MAQRILVLDGHPDPDPARFNHALAAAYETGAREAGHEVRTIALSALEFPLLRSKAAWETTPVPDALRPSQEALAWAEHIVIIFPLWLGGMPALLKGYLEQVARPGFAVAEDRLYPMGRKLLAGRSARLVVTMGMPSLVYRWYFRAHSVKALERNILGFVGIAPIHETLIGLVEGMDDDLRAKWLGKLATLGRRGE
ncbi:NAD(P)H-dependent oxidoreductase [Rhizobacter sp. LjRoot28]|uniref:NAD(P)H-dependent oxidoreductase n=1 Tax=Rhizobacter sp. LjRoot28 TaxID=3342309 RepID=UPI003ECE1D67